MARKQLNCKRQAVFLVCAGIGGLCRELYRCTGTGCNRHRAAQGVWWLRSPSARYNEDAGTVPAVGLVRPNLMDSVWAARPAFNLNLNAVLFSSAADGGKTDAEIDSNLTEVGTGSAEWKLTLKDTDRSFNASAKQHMGKNG